MARVKAKRGRTPAARTSVQPESTSGQSKETMLGVPATVEDRLRNEVFFIGGGGSLRSRNVATVYPEIDMEVIEIDPVVTPRAASFQPLTADALENTVMYAAAYANRASSDIGLDQLQQAIKDVSTAIQIDPEIPLAYVVRAFACTGMGQDAEAEQDLAKAARMGIGLAPLREEIERIKNER